MFKYHDKYIEEHDKVLLHNSMFEVMREHIMKSTIPIEEALYLISMLNYVEEGEIQNESYFLPKEYTNQELKRVLEVI